MSAPSKEEFYQSLNADTWCGWDWCRKLYGYQITDSEFLERVFVRLDELNRSRAKTIYGFYYKTQRAYEIEQERDAGAWLVDKTHKDYERKVKECQKKQFLNNSQQSNYLTRQNKRLTELRNHLV